MAKLNFDEKKLLIDLVKPVNRQLNVAWSLSILATILFVVQAWVLANIFNQWLLNQLQQQPINEAMLWQLLGLLLLCFISRPILLYLQQQMGSRASLQVRTGLRQRLLTTLANLGMARQQFGSDGSLSSQVIEQTDALDGYVSRFVVQKRVVLSTPLILLLACGWQSPIVAVILLCTAPFVPIFMILIGRMTAKKSAEQFSALAQLSGRFLDWVRGMTTLKRLQATQVAEADLSLASEQYRYRTMAVLKVAFLNGAVLELLSAFCIALVAIYLGFGLLGILPWTNDAPVGYLGALFILLLTPEFYAPLRQLGLDYHAQAQAEGAVKSLLPLLTKGDEVAQLHQGKNLQLDYRQAPSIRLDKLAIYHNIDNVETDNSQNKENNSASDNAYKRVRLAPFSVTIQSAERVGLIGQSGRGKSSLIQAIMGFLPYEGGIYINEMNHKSLQISHFREHVGYLAQEATLLPMSIADNLRLANPQATDEAIKHVLQLVDMYSLIQQLPEGINTKLQERGQGLSGGQQKRLCIAQLLLTDSQLWLLDEPTEHLDPDTADNIHQLLKTVSQDKTVIWITHAVESLTWLDRVIEI